MLGLLRRQGTFRHGVHPTEGKGATAGLAIERMPYVEEYVLPLSQHIGKPSAPIVEVGEEVRRGQLIAKADGFVSVALHAPASGRVAAIERRPHPGGGRQLAIVLRTDAYASQESSFDDVPHFDSLAPKDVINRVQAAGVVGLGGAAFPSHVKLSVPEGRKVRFAVLNGCECEPFLTCDHRVMLEQADQVIDGLDIMRRQLGAERAYIGVEANKANATEALREAGRAHDWLEVISLHVKYPQGAEKMLIDAIFQREVPSGGLPLDLEMAVNNVGTAVALSEFFAQGKPLIERVVTVSGPGIVRPANLLVPIGTPLSDVIDHCGGLKRGTRQVVLGGPMMGQSQKDLSIPVMKGTSGILALTGRPITTAIEEPCIRCGRCLEACALFLNPTRLAQLARAELVDELKALNALDCFECASCSFVCPSHIPLVQLIRMGKAMVRQAKTK